MGSDSMSEAIVVLNAGSSSLKFSIYRVSDDQLIPAVRGQIEGIGTSPRFKATELGGRVLADVALANKVRPKGSGHDAAFDWFFAWAREQYGDTLDPIAVGHRVTHGGADFTGPTLVDDNVVAKLTVLAPLVPLHQPHNLAGIAAVRRLRPDLPQVACFDTAFHRGRAPETERFGLPDEMLRAGIRRWGFHGLSYEFIASRLRALEPDIANGRVIVAHLGNGASLCAMKDGRSVETTMGFSTLDGLPMGTRCGSLDPGVILYLLRRNMSVEELETLLYRRSGLVGISGVSSDVRSLLTSNQPLAAEAISFFVYRITREIGSLTAALRGLDALVFTAGIGENSPAIRQRVCEGLGWLGITLERDANVSGRGRISPAGHSPSVWVMPTDEEAVIATGTLRVVRAGSHIQSSGR
jgi:acetate kinase